MIAFGCIAPVILGAAGVLVGNWLAGTGGAIWGGISGLIVGGVILGAMAQLMSRLRE